MLNVQRTSLETSRITDVLQHVGDASPEQTLVLFDIDETVATPEDKYKSLASSGWVSKMFKKLKNLSFLPLYYKLHREVVKFKPVEKDTVTVISDLQKRGFKVMALTLRSLNLLEATPIQLREIGIDFSQGAICDTYLKLNEKVVYKKGVLFCWGRHKGHCLKLFLDKTDYKPKKIILVDDRQKHIDEVRNVMQRDVDFVGLRYSKLDSIKNNVDLNAANEQIPKHMQGMLVKPPLVKPPLLL